MTDLLTELPTIENTNFRFQNQKVLLTYKTHINKEEFFAFLNCCAKGKGVRKYYCAHETGDETTPYEHSHMVVDFGFALQTRNQRYFDFNGIHPHISVIKTPQAWKKACKYLTKEDKTVKLNAEDSMDIATQVWSFDTMQEALQNVSDMKNVTATIALFGYKPLPLPEAEITEEEFYPWQKEMWEKLQYPPDGRTLVWLSDAIGGVGKTRFAKWCCITHRDKCAYFNSIGKIADFAMNIQNLWNTGWRGDTIFLNLSRSYSDRTNIYEACENILDGVITCTKYTGGTVWLPRLHVVCLSNFMPQSENLSFDRWRVYDVSERNLRPVTLKRAEGATGKNGVI